MLPGALFEDMFFKYNFFTILWALIIFMLILLPGQQMPEMKGDYFLSIDKLAHTFVFIVLAFLMIVGFKKQDRYKKIKTHAILYALIISGSYSLLLELLQLLSAERMVQISDAVANLTGCIFGYLAFQVVYKL